jgi:hypothetical protein
MQELCLPLRVGTIVPVVGEGDDAVGAGSGSSDSDDRPAWSVSFQLHSKGRHDAEEPPTVTATCFKQQDRRVLDTFRFQVEGSATPTVGDLLAALTAAGACPDILAGSVSVTLVYGVPDLESRIVSVESSAPPSGTVVR